MNFLLITFFLGATKLLLVESRCTNYNLLKKKNFDALCEEWWLESYRYSQTSSPRRKCIKLIEKKCPDMFTFETKIEKRFDTKRPRYETWKKNVQATRVTDSRSWVAYDVIKKYKLCFDDGGRSVTCEYWRKVAQEDRAKKKDKEFCTSQIRKYCKN